MTPRVRVLAVTAALVAFVALLGPGLRGPRVADPPSDPASAVEDVYDPVAAGEPTPEGFRQLLSRDVIRPIYEPVHVPADDIDWSDDTLVIGVAIGEEARAYPVQVLNIREMVNDRLGDTPILATW